MSIESAPPRRWGVTYAHWCEDIAGLEVEPCNTHAAALALMASLEQTMPGTSCCLVTEHRDGRWLTLDNTLTPKQWRAQVRG